MQFLDVIWSLFMHGKIQSGTKILKLDYIIINQMLKLFNFTEKKKKITSFPWMLCLIWYYSN